MRTFPTPPPLPAEQRTTTTVRFRYEDASQDGRFLLSSLAFGLGESVWSKLIDPHPATPTMWKQGIVPILSRLVMEATPGPFSPIAPTELDGEYALARTEKEGAVERILLSMWLTLRAPIGRIQGPKPSRAGEIEVAGRVYAEHVYTRLFAAPADRKVLRLDLPGLPAIPELLLETPPPSGLLTLPEGAIALDPGPINDDARICFGLCHTDANQHVNSLVYPRMFEEAALRRLAALGQRRAGLGRFAEIAYRKPFFAGDLAKIRLQAFTLGDRLGVAGAFYTDAEVDLPGARPHCAVQMLFEA